MSNCPVCHEDYTPTTIGRPQIYCSVKCRNKLANQKRKFKVFGKCNIQDCENRRRSAKSKWCEKHYMLWYRNGDPTTYKTPRGKFCSHCGIEMDTRRAFCDKLCRRRARMNAPGREIFCITCGEAMAHERMLHSLYCGSTCSTMAIRARRVGLEPHELWLKLQTNSPCEICGETVDVLHLDHDHLTGVFRGMLCNGCNVAIGMMKESQENLRKAIEYLAKTT